MRKCYEVFCLTLPDGKTILSDWECGVREALSVYAYVSHYKSF